MINNGGDRCTPLCKNKGLLEGTESGGIRYFPSNMKMMFEIHLIDIMYDKAHEPY